MYIRRKVFSVYTDEYGEERYFSTNEIMNEEDYLDELMYSDDESHIGRNVAIGAGALGAAGAGLYGAAKWGNKTKAPKEVTAEAINKVLGGSEKSRIKFLMKNSNMTEAQAKAALAGMTEGDVRAVLEQKAKVAAENSNKWRARAAKPGNWISRQGQKGINWAKGHKKTAAAIGAAGLATTGAGMYYAGRRDQKGRR